MATSSGENETETIVINDSSDEEKTKGNFYYKLKYKKL